jgi:GDP-D-mannose 3',5'-epimerase
MRTALVCGAGGFIGGHLVKRLKAEGFWVRGVDLKRNEFAMSQADDFVVGDLRDHCLCRHVVDRAFDEVYQLAADMGGAGFVFVGDNDADIMHNSGMINFNVLDACRKNRVQRVFYSSSACMYPAYNQTDPDNPNCEESSAYPAAPDSEYGWEKLFSERLYLAYARCYGTKVRIARYHNIFGPEGTWAGGREKAPAAMCRKVAEAPDGGAIEIWGDGNQTRSFMYIDDCTKGTMALAASEIHEPLNLGSSELVTINQLVDIVEDIAGVKLKRHYKLDAPKGVNGRNSDNTKILEYLGWEPSIRLRDGMQKTYDWIQQEMLALAHA